jgi:hypothetical protein
LIIVSQQELLSFAHPRINLKNHSWTTECRVRHLKGAAAMLAGPAPGMACMHAGGVKIEDGWRSDDNS